MAALAIVAGAAVLAFEAFASSHTSRGELWFWSIIGALTVLFGLAEFLFPTDRNPNP